METASIMEPVEPSDMQATLVDCYRIALDFRLPAAERAFALLDGGEMTAFTTRLPKQPINQGS